MLTVADEILQDLPGLIRDYPDGPSLKIIAAHMGLELAHVRAAARTLNSEARADLMRRMDSREQFLVPYRYRKAEGLRFCARCDATFEQTEPRKFATGIHYSNRRCCTRACAIAWSWDRPGVREKRKAGISVSKQTPEAKAVLEAHNKRRWSKPEEHARLSEQNRREWADPLKKLLRSQSIAATHRTPEMRKFYSDLRKAWWQIPEMRQKMCEAATKAKNTPEFKAYFSALLRERWKDPVWRKKWERAVRVNGLKGGRKKKQESQAA